MAKRLEDISIILVVIIFLIFSTRNCPIANADIYNNNNPDNSVELKIPLPFNSHTVDQTIDDKKKYIDNILPFP